MRLTSTCASLWHTLAGQARFEESVHVLRTLENHGLLRVVRHDEELILLHGIDDDRPDLVWCHGML